MLKQIFNNTEDIKSFILDKSNILRGLSWIIVYKYNEVIIGKVENNKIVLNNIEDLKPEILKELRLFNENGEIYLWKDKINFSYRQILESTNNLAIYSEKHYLWGNTIKENNLLVEDNGRGLEVKFSFPINSTDIKYQANSYYDFDKDGLIEFKDYRLVEFILGDK